MQQCPPSWTAVRSNRGAICLDWNAPSSNRRTRPHIGTPGDPGGPAATIERWSREALRAARSAGRRDLTWPHDQHRTGRVPHDVLRHAAEQQPANRASAVAPDEDHVDALGLGRLDDEVARVAGPDEERDVDPQRPAVLDELLRFGLAALADL